MKKSATSLALLLTIGCASTEAAPPPAQPESPPPTNVAAPENAVVQAPAEATPPPPTPEEIAAAEAQKKLDADFEKLEQENAAELERLTPEVRAQVQKLTDAGAPGIRSAINAALKGPQRRPGHAERDAQRHPTQTLEFLGIQPNHQVLEYGPGEGWYTALLAPALAKRGKLYVTMTDPNGPKTERATLYGKRAQLLLDSLPEAYSKVERAVIAPKEPKLPIADTSLNAVLLFRGAHGMVNSGTLETWLNEFHRVLGPKGILGVEQHRAAPGADPIESAKRGYLPEAFVIAEAEKAGFKLAAKSEINANPKDTKDYPNGVWALPPTLGGDEANREKYLAIGESDRMTLKFVKVERPKTAAPAASAPSSAAATSPTNSNSAASVQPTTAANTAPATAQTPAAAAPAAPPAAPAAPAAAPPAAPAAPAAK